MSKQLKTQLSLLLLAGIGTIGMTGYFVTSIHTKFALYSGRENKVEAQATEQVSTQQVAQATTVSSEQEVGKVLGASDNATANPLKGIYVNPFSGGTKSAATTSVRKTAAVGEAVVLSAMQPKPTAPIQSYIRGYVYPIAELNWCDSKQGCFQYCDEISNVPVCAMFSERQGMMKPEMVSVAQRLAVGLLSNNKFANCNTASSCVEVCDKTEFASDCADLVTSYELNSRVLGASDGTVGNSVASTQGNLPVNPYAGMKQDYSNPALTNYLANNSSSGCAPLDMICINDSQKEVSPRVLNMSIEDIPGGGGADGGGTTGGGSPINTTIDDCINSVSGGIIYRNETTILPSEINNATYGVKNCNQRYSESVQQNIESNSDAQKQESIGNIMSFQNCITGSRNIAADVTRCINQELR